LLSSWGIAFEAVNVERDPQAAAELQRRQVPLVPAVAVGEQIVHGWNPPALAALVGVPYSDRPQLSPSELAVRLDRILEATQRALRPVSAERLRAAAPGRDRTLGELGYHIFRLSLGFRDAAREKRFPVAWLLESAPAEMRDGAALARYGETVRAQLSDWFAAHPGQSFSVVVQTYYGAQSLHALLERTSWHAAQHLRQVYALLEAVGLPPEQPLGTRDYAGLPLPDSVW
jgi:hypothetical protein